MRPIEQSCFWLATRPRCVAPVPLAGNCRADVAVVGGGFTGLWTAFFLKQLDPACEVVVLEKGVTGYGGSGRNAGIVSNCIDHSHAAAVSHFGWASTAIAPCRRRRRAPRSTPRSIKEPSSFPAAASSTR